MKYIQEYEQELNKEDKSIHTVVSYLSDIKNFLQWYRYAVGENFDPGVIIGQDLKEYRSWLRTIKQAKPATINRRIVAMNKFFEWCLTKKYCHTNPAKDLKSIKEVQLAPKALDKKELASLKREIHKEGNLRDICIYEILINTGIRVSELANLTINDLTIQERKGNLIVRAGKGNKYRTIFLNKEARIAIQEFLEIRPGSRHNYLLSGQRGQLTPGGIFRVLQKYGHRAGLEVSPHVLRHTLATRLLRENKADIVTVATILGHSNLNTTMVYTRPSEKDIQEALENL